jgi:nicotinate-nucleotide adenylyltransferase
LRLCEDCLKIFVGAGYNKAMIREEKTGARIGIYAGTFNPVHAGHVVFALQAIEAAKLDRVYFMPERRPRRKQIVEHFGHRVAMLERALKPHNSLDVLEMVDVSFSVQRTLPELQQQFPGTELVFLMGSDVVPSLQSWPNIEQLLKQCELVVGVRASKDQKDRQQLKQLIDSWAIAPQALTIFDSYAPSVSSTVIREALRQRQPTKGLLLSVERYSNHHWLYVSVA